MADVTSWTDPAEEPSDTPVTGRRVRSFVSPGPVEVDARNLRGDVNLATGPIDRAQVTLTPRSPAGSDLAERAEVHLDQGRLTVDASAEGGAEVGQRLGAALQALLAPARRMPSRNEWRSGSRTWWPSARARPPCSTWR